MDYHITVTYNEQLINEAAKRFWMRLVGRKFLLGVLIFLVACGLWFLDSKTWYTATLVALALIFLFIAVATFFVNRRRSLSIFREMESPTASWRFTEENIAVESDVAKAEYKWNIVKKLWRFDDVWLLLYANQTYSTLPIADVPEEVKDFIVRKVRSTGGKIS